MNPPAFIPGISLIRIILCLMICLFHWTWRSPAGGGVGVDWFIILSGFLMMFTLKKEKFSISSFYISKFARLWPLLFTAFLLSALLSCKSHFNFNNLVSVLIASFGGNQFVYQYTGDNYPLWYMKIEILMVLCFPLVAYGRKYLLLMLALSFAAALACIFFQEPGKQLYAYFPYRLWQFLAGCYAAHLYKKHARFFSWSPVIFACGTLYLLYQTFIGTFLIGEENISMGFLLPDTLIAVLTISSACSMEKFNAPRFIKIPSGVIHLVNQASLLTYAIFLLHIPVLNFMQYIWTQYRYGAYSPLFWLLSCLLLIVVGIILHYGIEQPCGKWLSSRLKRSFSLLRNYKNIPRY